MTKDDRVETYWREYAAASGVAGQNYSAWPFGDSPEMANELLALVVGGDKRATAGAARDYSEAEPIPKPGDHSIVLDGDGAPACILRTTEVTIKPLSAADDAFAFDEGEGDRSLAWWMDGHVEFFRRQAETEGYEFSPDEPTVFERFEVVWPRCPAVIRPEEPADVDAVRALTTEAFAASDLGDSGEAGIIDAIRTGYAGDIVSLVAESEGAVVGHALLSPATIGELRGMGLGPMAVAPGMQGQRIGAALIRAGLRELRQRGCPFVIVLGHPTYYPRFGFRPAAARGIESDIAGVPSEAFMVLILDPSVTPRGVARYVPELSG